MSYRSKELAEQEVPSLYAVIEALKKRGYTQKQLSRLIDVSEASLSLYATNKRQYAGVRKYMLLYTLLDLAENSSDGVKVMSIQQDRYLDGEGHLVTYYG